MRQRRRRRQRAVQRIGGIDGLQLDQRLVGAVRQPRHGAHRGGLGHRAETFEEGLLRSTRLALHEFEAQIAAEQRLALIGDARRNRARHRVDAADRGDAERDAGEEDQETRQAAAHLAQREADGELQHFERRAAVRRCAFVPPAFRLAILFPQGSGESGVRYAG